MHKNENRELEKKKTKGSKTRDDQNFMYLQDPAGDGEFSVLI